MKALPILAAFVAVLAVRMYRHYVRLNTTLKEISITRPTCEAAPQKMPGPEDMTFSHKYRVLFVSSHDRRHMTAAVGTIFQSFVDDSFDVTSKGRFHFSELKTGYPEYFRPHGMTIYEGEEEFIRLYVISHSGPEAALHTIEVFDYSVKKREDFYEENFKHVQTIINSDYLESPNDLFAVGLDSLLISNDHRKRTPKALQLLDDVLKNRYANVVHYAGRRTGSPLWAALNSSASFGNGIVGYTDRHTGKEYVYRSSAADYSLLKYELVRGDAVEDLSLKYISEQKLPISPDNLEYDGHAHSVIITGHVSTYLFMAHAITRLNIAPSSVLKLELDTDTLHPLFLDPTGNFISASSEGLVVHNDDYSKSMLYIGQVFNPEVLVCIL
jgi:hypothetical protein